jgi:hypothetical protein
MDRIVGGVEIERDPVRRPGVGVEEQLDKQPLDSSRVMRDAPVTMFAFRRVLKAVEGALACQERAMSVTRLEPPQHSAEHRVVAQLVMIDEILIAKGDAEDPLTDQGGNVVHDTPGGSPVLKARRKALDEPDGPFSRPQQQPACVRGDRAAAKISNHSTPLKACKQHRFRVTLCRHRGILRIQLKCLLALTLSLNRTLDAPLLVRNGG